MVSQHALGAVLVVALVMAASPSAAAQDHPGTQAYRQVCELCHGEAGRGDIAPALVPFGFDAEYVLAVVREGYGQMPPISRRELDDDAVRQVVGYLEVLTSPAAADEIETVDETSAAAAGGIVTQASPAAADEIETVDETSAAAAGGIVTQVEAATVETAEAGSTVEAVEVEAGGAGVETAAAPEQTAGVEAGYDGPRTSEGQPDLNGIWQTLNAASWDIRAHNAQDGVPAGLGVVEGGEIPYQPWAAAQQRENYANRLTADPLRQCFLPGVPRVTYLPFPFRILQTPDHVVITYEFAHVVRIIYTDGSPHPLPNDFWMGDSRGHWDGDTLVVDTTHFNGRTWFDAAGNFHSDQLHVVERYTPITPYHLDYEVTIEDPGVFTRPWTMRMPLYRRMDDGLQLLDYDCVDFILQALETPEGGAR